MTRRLLFALFVLAATSALADNLVSGPVWLGDHAEDATIQFIWRTTDSAGASVTRTTDGTVSVYKDNGGTESTTGVTDTEDFDSLTGVHVCTVDTSDAFYAVGADYTIVLSAATVDSQAVNAVLAHFSLENRFDEADVVAWNGTVSPAEYTAGYPIVTMKQPSGTGSIATNSGRVYRFGYDNPHSTTGGSYSADSITMTTLVDAALPGTQDNEYVDYVVMSLGTQNWGHKRQVVAYDATAKKLITAPDWNLTPDATMTYGLYYPPEPPDADAPIHAGLAQAGASGQITLSSMASSSDGDYVGSVISLIGGTGFGQHARILTYNGTSKVATVTPNWRINPDSATVYEVEPVPGP